MRLFPFAIATALALSMNVQAGELSVFSTPNASIGGMSPSGAYASALASDIFGLTCYRWMRATGAEDPVAGINSCTGINDAGTIAGSIPVDGGNGFGGHDEPALAVAGTAAPQVLPLPDGFENAQARGVSADANAAVGIAINAAKTSAAAFLWTTADGTVQLPVDSGNSGANAISADGHIVVGWADEPQFGARRAVIWQDGIPSYPLDSQSRHLGEAQAISANGRFVVGNGFPTDDGTITAWRWDAETGEAIPLHGLALTGGVSDDGAVVVGDSGFLANRLLMVWRAGAGTVTLLDDIAARGIVKPAGWVILAGTFNGLSSDGSTLGACCGPDFDDFTLHSFVITDLSHRPDAIFAAGFEPVLAVEPVADSGFEATPVSGGPNPSWEGLDTNPDAVGVDGGDPTNFYSAAFGGIATHRGLWSVFFGGWLNGFAETQDFSQTITLPAGATLYVNYWRFAAQLPDAGTLSVTIDGDAVQTTDLATLPGAELDFVPQSADISEYADGGAHVLRVVYAYPGGANDGFVFVDDVSVGTSAIAAEPVIGATSATGSLAMLLQRKR